VSIDGLIANGPGIYQKVPFKKLSGLCWIFAGNVIASCNIHHHFLNVG
jgi:hypothetical protein